MFSQSRSYLLFLDFVPQCFPITVYPGLFPNPKLPLLLLPDINLHRHYLQCPFQTRNCQHSIVVSVCRHLFLVMNNSLSQKQLKIFKIKKINKINKGVGDSCYPVELFDFMSTKNLEISESKWIDVKFKKPIELLPDIEMDTAIFTCN